MEGGDEKSTTTSSVIPEIRVKEEEEEEEDVPSGQTAPVQIDESPVDHVDNSPVTGSESQDCAARQESGECNDINVYDSGYAQFEADMDDDKAHVGELSATMPSPPPPSPMIKTPSTDQDVPDSAAPAARIVTGKDIFGERHQDSDLQSEDVTADASITSEYKFTASSTNKIVINLPGKSKPKSPKPVVKDTASAWLDYEESRFQTPVDDLGELVLDLGELEPDHSDALSPKETPGEDDSGGTTASPARPSGPPSRPSAPPTHKPQRPPPPRPAPPKKNWETFESGPPSRPPPPKKSPRSPGADEVGEGSADESPDIPEKKGKSKLGISTKKIKSVLDKKTKSGKKDKKEKDLDFDNLVSDRNTPVPKDTEQWKEFEAMQQRITSSLKQSQVKVSEMESGFETEIKKLDVQSQSPWAVAQAGPGAIIGNEIPTIEDPENLMDDKKTTWVGFEDNFNVTPNIELSTTLPHLSVTPITTPKLPMTPNNSARGSSEDLANKANMAVDLLGLGDNAESGGSEQVSSTTAAAADTNLRSDLFGICGDFVENDGLVVGESSERSAVALDIVDDFLGVDAVKAASQEIITDPLKKLELMKSAKDKEAAVDVELILDDDDPFGLGTSAKSVTQSDDTVYGDLFILEDYEKQEIEERRIEGTTSSSEPCNQSVEISLTTSEPSAKPMIISSPTSDDFDPRADISVEQLNVKPAADIPTQPAPSSKVVDRALARPRPKAAAKAPNPFNLVLDVDEAPVAAFADDEPNLLGEEFTATSTNPFTSSEAEFSVSNPFAGATSEEGGGANLFDFSKEAVLSGEGGEAGSSVFNPFATIAEGEASHPADAPHDANFDPFQTIHDDDAFDLHLTGDSVQGEKTGDDAEEAVSPTRFNPFDKEPPLDEKFAKFEPEPKADDSLPGSSGASTQESIDLDEEVEPLPPFYPSFGEEGWNLLLRQPVKKKLTQNRFWKPVFVRLSIQKDVPTIRVFNNDKETQPIHELPLQPAYQLCNMGLQQYDQFGKCHTVKVQYIFYRERVGVKAERITPTLSDLTRVRNLKGLKDLVHRPKTTMILDHAPQTSELLKFGALTYDDIRTFIREVEDALFHLKSGRDSKSMQYKKDEITVDLVDEYYAEIDKDGHIVFHKGRVRMFCLAFITGGMPLVEVGLNDKRRQGKEVVGRKDIVPIKTDEWIRMQDAELHSIVENAEYEKTKIIKFAPLDACQFEIMRFRTRPRLNKELPLQIRCQMAVIGKHVEIRGDVMIPGYHSNSRRSAQTPCEDIQIRFPIPEPWFYMFRTEKRFRYGTIHSTTRKPGKIKGLERLSMMAHGMMPPSLIEVSKGTAKFENVHQAIVWKIAKLPERNEEAYKTHLFVLKMDLGPHDTVPETFDQYITVEYSMPNSTVSRAQIRSIGVNSDEPPDRWCHHLAKYEYKVGIDFCDKPKAPNQTDVVMMPIAPTSPKSDGDDGSREATEGEEEDHDSDSSDSSSDSD